MKLYARLICVCLTLALPAIGLAADKAEEAAKAAAVDFLKAVKTKDADKVAKLCDVPFAYKEGSLMTLDTADELKKWLADKLSEIQDPDKVPTDVSEMMPWATVKEKIKEESERTLAEKVMGKDGFLAVVQTTDDKKVGVVIRMTKGKARIVGLIR